jgi:hypothetical protein
MPLKIKSRPTGKKAPISTVQPPVSHDVTNEKAAANAASCRPLIATQPASGTANHARHHVSRHTQS